MTKREYEKIKLRLNRYRVLREKVGRLAEEAARWNAMAELSAPELQRSGRGGGGHYDMGALKSSAMTIEEERDKLAQETMAERQLLMAACARLEDSTSRDLLEQIYISGATTKSAAAALGISERTAFRKMNEAFRLLAQEEKLWES